MKIYTQRIDATHLSDDDLNKIEQQRTHKRYLNLDFDTRQRSRFKAITEAGQAVGIDLPRTDTLKNGSILSNDNGDLIQVMAAKQSLIKVTADNGFVLMQGAYHLGNRHIPLMITPDALYFEPDHVLEAMLTNLGLYTHQVQAPFEPETGAYKGGHGHSHSHSHHEHNHQHKRGTSDNLHSHFFTLTTHTHTHDR